MGAYTTGAEKSDENDDGIGGAEKSNDVQKQGVPQISSGVVHVDGHVGREVEAELLQQDTWLPHRTCSVAARLVPGRRHSQHTCPREHVSHVSGFDPLGEYVITCCHAGEL